MKVINKKLVSMLCILVIVLSIGIFLICNKSSEKITLDEVKLKEPEKNSGMFAIMLEQNAGEKDYAQSENETFPKEGYTLNEEKSGCLDSDGKKLENVTLSFNEETGRVKVDVENTSYCYIYFDKEDPEAKGKALAKEKFNGLVPSGFNSLVSGDMYRFQGTNANVENYICFGDTTCNSGDNHMYRIIGMDDKGRLKIVKEASIGPIVWDSRNKENITWNEAELKTKLNGNEFLDNTTTYIPANWKNLIDDKIEWKYGDVSVSNVNATGISLYSIEQSWENSVTASIGLMYISDYYLAYSDDIICNTNYYICGTSWLHISDNRFNEWTMSRNDYSENSNTAWLVSWQGYVTYTSVINISDPIATSGVRPVFYLKSSVKITGGDGKIDTPFTITP